MAKFSLGTKKILLAKIYGLVIRFLICYWDLRGLDLPGVKIIFRSYLKSRPFIKKCCIKIYYSFNDKRINSFFKSKLKKILLLFLVNLDQVDQRLTMTTKTLTKTLTKTVLCLRVVQSYLL